MNLDALSNFFSVTAEMLIGILAFQGIATTFIFSKKGEWTYMDVWEFFWLIFNNVTGIIVSVFSICIMITVTDLEEVIHYTFNFIFLMLAVTIFFMFYSINKVNLRSLIDKDTEEEMNTPLAKFFDKVYYFITLVPFVLPIIYYNTNLISFNFVLYWVCACPWIWCAVSFTNFSKLIHHSLRIVEEDKLQTTGTG